MNSQVIIPSGVTPNEQVEGLIDEFLKKFKPYEALNHSKLLLYLDEKSGACYLVCHLDAKSLAAKSDLEATLDGGDDDEVYKLNREVTEDKVAYKNMLQDALSGRSFEDLVLEYDTTYHPEKPLKVYGGQHRIKAISNSGKARQQVCHGVRVYFALTREQKIDIATVNNTSIAVPNDLLDRMQEQLLGPELRDWCQATGLLATGHDFADRKSPDVPTARVVRTLLVNYFKGKSASDEILHQPVVCSSGGKDDRYLRLRATINWQDADLLEMGRQFVRLHQTQMERVKGRTQDGKAEYARKAISLCVVASWSYAAGLFQSNPQYLKVHYSIPDTVKPPQDPLNAKDLSQARLIGVDEGNYRGLGARINPDELGRMLELFWIFSTKDKKKAMITRTLAEAAIQSFHAKKQKNEADKKIRKL